MRRPGRHPSLFLLAALLLPAAAPGAQAQPKQPSAAFLEGTEVFRRILFESGFQPLGTFADLDADPRHSILIVLGDPRRLSEIRGGLRDYVGRGGALFLATDRKLDGEAANALRQTAGVAVSGAFVVCDRPDSCYHQLADCPFLRPMDADPDLFRNLKPEGGEGSIVASNAPSHLERVGGPDGVPYLSPLATLPTGCRLEAGGAGRDEPQPWDTLSRRGRPLFAVGGDVGGSGGRVLVMADHSVFINEMMLPEDNGNVEFTYNCLEWLRGDDEPRTKVLFLEEGNINKRFEVPLKDVLPDEVANRILDFLWKHMGAAFGAAEKTAPAIERNLENFDENDSLNRGLLRTFNPNSLLCGLAVVLAVFAVLYGCWKVGWKARHRSDLQGPLLTAALYRLAPAGSVPEQRRKAQIEGDNFGEPARDLARQMLGDMGVPAAAPPRVDVRGGWLRRWTMTGRVKRLWRLAYGPPARVSLREWRRLLRDVKELKGAIGNGTVRIT